MTLWGFKMNLRFSFININKCVLKNVLKIYIYFLWQGHRATTRVVEAALDGEEIVQAWEKCTRKSGMLLPCHWPLHSVGTFQSFKLLYSSVAPAACCCRYVLCYFFLLMRIFVLQLMLYFRVYSPLGCCLDFSHAFHEIHMCGATCFDYSGPSSIVSLDQEEDSGVRTRFFMALVLMIMTIFLIH
jgi:hypothetical protein